MTQRRYPGDCWPSDAQKELLILALQGDEAKALWTESWHNKPFTDLDRACERLLPLIWHNLSRLDISGAMLTTAQVCYRQTWYKNQLMLRHLSSVLEPMLKAGITPIVVKGGALILTTYDSPALRPMGDFDVLVHPEDAEKAIETLGPDWVVPSGEKPVPGISSYKHAQGFRSQSSSFEIDLHWNLLPESVGTHHDDAYWTRARPVTLPTGLDVLTLSPTDQLFHSCIHGVKNDWGSVAPLWWIADATWLIRKHAIDWQLLLETAVEQRLILPLRYALDYLSAEMNVDIPSQTLACFHAQPVTAQEQSELAAKTARFNYYRRVQIHWYSFRRLDREAAGLMLAPRFLRYLQARWGVKGGWETATFIIRTYVGRKIKQGPLKRRRDPEC